MVADLLARGSRSPVTFPGMRVSQWQIGRRLTAHSCGGSRGIGRLVAHAPRSLLIPTGTTVAILSRYGRRGQVTAMAQHVCFWHLADIRTRSADVRFWG